MRHVLAAEAEAAAKAAAAVAPKLVDPHNSAESAAAFVMGVVEYIKDTREDLVHPEWLERYKARKARRAARAAAAAKAGGPKPPKPHAPKPPP